MVRAGIQLRTLELLRSIDRRRCEQSVCILSGLPGELDDEVRAAGNNLYPLPQGEIGFSRRFRGLLRQERFDVVHVHLHHYSGYLLRLAAKCGTPVRIAHYRSSRSEPVRGLTRRIWHGLMRPWSARHATEETMRGWIDSHATHILGASQWALDACWGPAWRSDPRCAVVYDGLEPAPFAAPPDSAGVRAEFGVPAGAPLVIHVGRITEAKNHLRLMSVFAEVLRRLPDARLLLVGRTLPGRGDAGIEGQIRRRIEELRITNRVIFAGERADVPRLVKAADVLIFPSLWEGLGDVVLEACAAGTPVLASALPCIREIAERLPGVRCLSLDEPDSVWADVAEELVRRPRCAADRQLALQSFAESPFTVANCARVLCSIWENGLRPRLRKGTVPFSSNENWDSPPPAWGVAADG